MLRLRFPLLLLLISLCNRSHHFVTHFLERIIVTALITVLHSIFDYQ